MEWRELEILLVLSEELHFGRTAERLFLSQPRVSQTVRRLEEQVGGVLFERSSRRVRLTPLGERLVADVRPAVEQIRRAFAAATDVARGVGGTLRICVPTYSMAGPSFIEIVRTFRARHPDCRVVVTEVFPGDLQRLRTGAYDLMCHRQPLADPDLTIGPVLSREAQILLVGVDDPLARRGRAGVEDFADRALIDRSGIPDHVYDAYFPQVTPSGRPIPRGPAISATSEVLHLVAAGTIVHPTVESFSTYYRHPEVTHVPLTGVPAVDSTLVWVTDRETATIRAFADVTAEVVDLGP